MEQNKEDTSKEDTRKSKRTAIQVLHKENPNLSISKISKLIKVHYSTAKKWISRNNIEELPKSHFTKLTPEIIEYIKENAPNMYSAAEGSSSRKMAQKITDKFEKSIQWTSVKCKLFQNF